MKKLIVLAVASFFATSAFAGEMKWNGSAGMRWTASKNDDGLNSKNNTTAGKDVSSVKGRSYNMRANLGVTGGWENVEWGTGLRTGSATANNDWQTLNGAGDQTATIELAWFRYLKDFGSLDVSATVGRQKNVFAYDQVSQNLFDNDVRFDGLGWQFNYGMFGLNAGQYVLGAKSQGTNGASTYTKTEASDSTGVNRSKFNMLYGFQPHMKWKFSDEIEAMFAVGYYVWNDDSNTNLTGGGFANTNTGTVAAIAPQTFKMSNPRQWQILANVSLPMNFSFIGEYVMNKKSVYNNKSVFSSATNAALGTFASNYTGASDVTVGRNALALSIVYGKVKKAHDWSLSYTYSTKGIASVINRYSNDTFLADNKGHIINAAYAIADNFTLGATAMMNQEKERKNAATGLAYTGNNVNQKNKMSYYEINTGVMF